MGDTAARMKHILTTVKASCPEAAEDLEGVIPMVERMEDALARVEAECLLAEERQAIWPDKRGGVLTIRQVRKAVMGP